MPLTRFSLSSRLWLVLALAMLPLLGLTIKDYFDERNNALANIEQNARSLLYGARIEEEPALRDVAADYLNVFFPPSPVFPMSGRPCPMVM